MSFPLRSVLPAIALISSAACDHGFGFLDGSPDGAPADARTADAIADARMQPDATVTDVVSTPDVFTPPDVVSMPDVFTPPDVVSTPDVSSAPEAALPDVVTDDATSDDDGGGAERGCTSTGGTIGTRSCCAAASDFPQDCRVTIGGCTCAPSSSRQIRTCVCPTGACFNGSRCVTD